MVEIPVLIFDGDCAFCTSAAGWIARKWREPARTTPWQFLTADEETHFGVTKEQAKAQVWWVDRRGAVGAEQAVARALAHAGAGWRVLGFLIGARAGRPLMHPIYFVVARHRHRLPGATPACRLRD